MVYCYQLSHFTVLYNKPNVDKHAIVQLLMQDFNVRHSVKIFMSLRVSQWVLLFLALQRSRNQNHGSFHHLK